MKTWAIMTYLLVLAIIGGISYGLYMDYRLRRSLRTADSLQVAVDSLRHQSDSLLAISHHTDSVFIHDVVTHLVTKWDTVRVDSIVYVPLAQADSVKQQRDACLIAWDQCRTARTGVENALAVTRKLVFQLRDQIARDSAKDNRPHLELGATAGVGAVKPFGNDPVVAGYGVIAGVHVWNLRLW